MTARIGWYVHHHGRGHLTRMLAIAPHLDAEIVCFSSLAQPDALPAGVTWITLPRDDDPAPRLPHDDPAVRGALHWAPLHHPGHRSRFATIAAAVAGLRLAAFVVDVSVEVTLLVRLLGVPVVVITQPGVRDDDPHRLGYAAAERIIAPWPREVYAPGHLTALGERVAFVGGISRFAGRGGADGSRGGTVVLLGGGGGAAVSSEDVAAAERATGSAWLALGVGAARWRPDPWEALTTASAVVSWAGQNAVADVAAAAAPAIVIPQERPFDEQHATATALGRAGLAVVAERWPDPPQWPALIERARGLGAPWHRWRVDGAAQRAADVIAAVIAR